MNPFLLLPGILVALVLFGAGLWSLAEAVRRTGFARIIHLATVASLMATMVTLSAGTPIVAQIAGGFVLASGLATTWISSGWARLLPLALSAFGATVLWGLPFASD